MSWGWQEPHLLLLAQQSCPLQPLYSPRTARNQTYSLRKISSVCAHAIKPAFHRSADLLSTWKSPTVQAHVTQIAACSLPRSTDDRQLPREGCYRATWAGRTALGAATQGLLHPYSVKEPRLVK